MTSSESGSTPPADAGGVEPHLDTQPSSAGASVHPEKSTGSSHESGWRSWISTIVTVLVTVLVLFTVRHTLVDWYKVPSESMQQLLQPGDLILVDMREKGEEPARGSVIVFDGSSTFGTNPGPIYVKRVIGVGGDNVKCCSEAGKLVLNGKELDEPYVYPGDSPSDIEFDVTVPDGKLWMMGDHRSVSGDSREHLGDPGGGMVPVSDVIGPVTAVVWPWSRHQTVSNPER